MITLANHQNGFRVKVSEPGMGVRGYSVQAHNLEEAIEAIRHYFSEPYHATSHDDCPFCRVCPEQGGMA